MLQIDKLANLFSNPEAVRDVLTSVQDVFSEWAGKKFSNSDDKLLNAAESLRTYELEHLEDAKEAPLIGYAYGDYLLANVVTQLIVNHGLVKTDNDKWVLSDNVVAWLKQSQVAQQLLYPAYTYDEDKNPAGNILPFFADANKGFIAGLNHAIQQKNIENEKIKQETAVDEFIDTNYFKFTSQYEKNILLDFLVYLRFPENEESLKHAFEKLDAFGDTKADPTEKRLEVLLKLLAWREKDQDFNIHCYRLYDTLLADKQQHQYIENILSKKDTDEARAMLAGIKAYEQAKKTADKKIARHTTLMGFGGAAFGADVAVGTWEILFLLGLNISKNELYFSSLGSMLFLSVFMGLFFKYGHKRELYKAELEENFDYEITKLTNDKRTVDVVTDEVGEKATIEVYEDNQEEEISRSTRLYAWMVKQFGTSGEGVMSAVGIFVGILFVCDMHVIRFAGAEADAAAPGQFLVEKFGDTDEGIAILAIAGFFCLLFAMSVGYSLKRGHETLDGPNSDEYLFQSHRTWKTETQLPTQGEVLSFDWKSRAKASLPSMPNLPPATDFCLNRRVMA